jgi:hypothetical protein
MDGYALTRAIRATEAEQEQGRPNTTVHGCAAGARPNIQIPRRRHERCICQAGSKMNYSRSRTAFRGLMLSMLALVCALLAQFALASGAHEIVVHSTFSRADASVHGKGMITTANGDTIVYGFIFDDSGPHSKGWIARTNSLGHTFWEREIGDTEGDSSIQQAVALRNGAVLLLGTTDQVRSGTFERSVAVVAKLNTSGDTIWQRRIGAGSDVHIPTQIRLLSNGHIIVAGLSRKRFTNRQVDGAFLSRLDSTGSSVVDKRSAGTNRGNSKKPLSTAEPRVLS